ncbi:MAG: DUF2179 domain-containing protein [Cyclobacteriaceae bacterium]|nr:DUF2179 domain-containing protein [Cyclobacteriaceae bacterium]
MIDIIAEKLGMELWVGDYIILPVLIFIARIMDVSMATLRIIFVIQGNHRIAPVVGFFESLIWLIAISQIMVNIDNIATYVAFSAGFATGTYVGIKIEEKLAIGKVLVRVITRVEAIDLIEFLKTHDFYFTVVPAEGRYGKVNVLFFVINRERLPIVLNAIKIFNPKAFYTVESVKNASEYHLGESTRKFIFFERQSLKRK